MVFHRRGHLRRRRLKPQHVFSPRTHNRQPILLSVNASFLRNTTRSPVRVHTHRGRRHRCRTRRGAAKAVRRCELSGALFAAHRCFQLRTSRHIRRHRSLGGASRGTTWHAQSRGRGGTTRSPCTDLSECTRSMRVIPSAVSARTCIRHSPGCLRLFRQSYFPGGKGCFWKNATVSRIWVRTDVPATRTSCDPFGASSKAPCQRARARKHMGQFLPADTHTSIADGEKNRGASR